MKRVRYTTVEVFACEAPQYVLEGQIPPDDASDLIYEFPLLCNGSGKPFIICADCRWFGGFEVEIEKEEIVEDKENKQD